MIIRLATPSDLDAMTWVLINTSPLDPVYPYRFPDRHLYPNEFASLCRHKCAEYLATSTVVVCEMPTNPRCDTQTSVVAFSAWAMPPSSPSPSHPPPPTSSTSHTSYNPPSPSSTLGNLTRQSAFRTTLSHQKALLFDTPFARNGGHVFLKILLVHPSHQRKGAGTALTQWGMEQAWRMGVHTTVFASPMGLALYRRLGFVEVGRFRVQCAGEGEFVEIPALVLGRGLVGGVREGENVRGAGKGGEMGGVGVRTVGMGVGMGMGLVCGRRVGDCLGGYEAAACA